MKIALVSPYDYAYPGGVKVHVSALEEQFSRKGHEVKIIAPCSRPEENGGSAKTIFMGRPFPISASGSVVRIPISPRLFFSHRIKRILDEERFDVVHIHEPLLPALSTSVIHHSSGALNVGTFHAYRDRSWAYRYFGPLLKRWVYKLNGRIAVSRPARDFIARYFPGDYDIIPNGISLDRFSDNVEPIEKFCDGKLNILFVGRLEQRKGLKYLLSAYEMIRHDMPHCRLIVVAPPSRQLAGFSRYVEERHLKDVVFTGYVSGQDLPSYYKTAHVFCSPATGRESFGLVLLEAMATARPVVVSNIPGYASVIDHGVQGLLVKPQDQEALAGALLQVLRNDSLRENMGKMGRQKAEEYSWEKVADRVLAHYKSLLTVSSGAR